jgi:hypothetical protein
MKKALIKKPCKTNMQSGLKKTKSWVVEFQFDSSLKKDVLMGWSSSKNTNKQIKLSFSNLEDAMSWCSKNDFSYEVEDQSLKTIKPKSYSSNFSTARRTSWTH